MFIPYPNDVLCLTLCHHAQLDLRAKYDEGRIGFYVHNTMVPTAGWPESGNSRIERIGVLVVDDPTAGAYTHVYIGGQASPGGETLFIGNLAFVGALAKDPGHTLLRAFIAMRVDPALLDTSLQLFQPHQPVEG